MLPSTLVDPYYWIEKEKDRLWDIFQNSKIKDQMEFQDFIIFKGMNGRLQMLYERADHLVGTVIKPFSNADLWINVR